MASNTPIVSLGASIIWADVDPKTGLICPDSIAKQIDLKTKAIIPAHMYGVPVDMGPLMAMAKAHGTGL